MNGGISALFATGVDMSLESHLKSLSFSLDLPLILPTSSFYDNSESLSRSTALSSGSFQMNGYPLKLTPSKSLLAMALRDAVLFLNWTRVALLYEEPDGKLNLTNVICLTTTSSLFNTQHKCSVNTVHSCSKSIYCCWHTVHQMAIRLHNGVSPNKKPEFSSTKGSKLV